MSYCFSHFYFYFDGNSFSMNNLFFYQNTTFGHLFDSISNLYPHLNICPCFDYKIKNNQCSYFNANEDDTLYNFYNKYGSGYLYVEIKLNGKQCKCNKQFKEYYSKTKKEIINDFESKIKYLEEKVSFLNKVIEEKDNIITKKTKENKNYLKESSEYQKKIDKLEVTIEDLKNKKRNVEDDNQNQKNVIELLKKEIQNLKKKIELKENEIKDKNEENIKNIKEYSENQVNRERKITDLNNKIYELNIEDKNKKNEIESLKKEIQNLKNEKLESEKKNKSQEDKIINLEKEIEESKEKEKILKLAADGDVDALNIIQQSGIGKDLKSKYNTIAFDESTNLIVENKNYELSNELQKFNKNFEDFYDIIINIKSIKDINKGWEIKSNEKGKKQYMEKKNEPVLKIGVIGNADKGKSFLLSKISKIDLPSGPSISTEGLSIKYPDLEGYEYRKIVLLDSAGLETPVIKETKENNNVNEKELFKEKSREKLITELFLQNYIMHNSDILLIVVGKFTYSEQKLLNKIKTDIQRAKLNKTVFIIHNLFTFFSKKQVEDHIQDYLLKSATFELEEGHKITTEKSSKNGTYYYEKNFNSNGSKIFHLIFANEGSEAGKFYNKFTLDFIEKEFQNVINLKPFDVIETVKERFIEISNDIIELIDKNPFNKESFEETEEYIKLKDNQEIILKKCLIDELGFSNLKVNGFEPTYNYYKKDDSIEIKIECPGNFSIAPKINFLGEYTVIKINGEKKKDDEKIENMRDCREYGKFCVDIPLKSEDYLLSREKPKIQGKNGILIINYLLEKQVDNEVFEFGDS